MRLLGHTAGSPYWRTLFWRSKKARRGDRAASGLTKKAECAIQTKASTGSARTFDTSGRTETVKGFNRLSPNGWEVQFGRRKEFGSGRFEGQSTNSPSLRLALRVLRFAAQ